MSASEKLSKEDDQRTDKKLRSNQLSDYLYKNPKLQLMKWCLNIKESKSYKQQMNCAGNLPEFPFDPDSKLKFYLKKLATTDRIAILPLDNDMIKILKTIIQKTEETVQGSSQNEWTNSGKQHSRFHFISFARSRKRKHYARRRRNRKKRPRLVQEYSTLSLQNGEQHERRKYLYPKCRRKTRNVARSESAVCKLGNIIMYFHVDWGSLPSHLNPREQYLGELLETTTTTPMHNTVQFSVVCKGLTMFKFEDLLAATNQFDSRPLRRGGKLIGSGSFGDVFFARVIHNRIEHEVAIKKFKQPQKRRLSATLMARKQFPTEVGILMRAHLGNIPRLIGLSTDGPELCIVCEYIPGGTLAQRLSKDCSTPLVWRDRMNVSIGVCRAVKYLHTEMVPPMIHRDIKSSNILLSSDCVGKLSDFGLACSTEYESDPDESFEESGSISVGTRCYMPPEAFKGRFSTKTDVYSLGVVLYEVVTGLPPYSHAKKKDLVTFMRELCSEDADMSVLFDPRASWPSLLATPLLTIAQQSTVDVNSERPRIAEILHNLEEMLLHWK